MPLSSVIQQVEEIPRRLVHNKAYEVVYICHDLYPLS